MNAAKDKKLSDIPLYDSIADLLESMRFAPSTAGVWFETERMLLLHAKVFGNLRDLLIETQGLDAARKALTRIGFERGKADFALVSQISSRNTKQDRLFSAGPQLMSIMGITGPAPEFNVHLDDVTGHTVFDAASTVSVESELHLETHGISDGPVCWLLHGYATGYCTAATGAPFLVREMECRATGHQHCKSIGQPLEDWRPEHAETMAFLFEDGDKSPAGLPPMPRKTLAVERSDTATAGDLETKVVGQSAGFKMAQELIRRIAPTDATALFLGETGVGKEVLARQLHRLSDRADKPLVIINCAAIPDELLESELFGVERGGYTGATKNRLGRFERADGGTLFLDEIGTLSLSAQAKVLRAIQNGEIERIGDQRTRKVDVRVVAATNVDLAEAAQAGTFRQDLYYRLNVFPITIPPLRERRADIRLLTDLFIRRYSLKYKRTITGISVDAMDLMWSHSWPGNVRELENVIERGIVLAADSETLEARHIFVGKEQVDNIMLSPNVYGRLAKTSSAQGRPRFALTDDILNVLETDAAQEDVPMSELVKEIETRLVLRAVNKAKGNLSGAARALGMTRAQIAYRLEQINAAEP